LNAKKISELADKAHSLYVLQSSVEQGKLLKKLLVMCRVDATHLYPAYRKPLDLLMSSQNPLVRKQSSPV
jgi:hypothetical protein